MYGTEKLNINDFVGMQSKKFRIWEILQDNFFNKQMVRKKNRESIQEIQYLTKRITRGEKSR